MLVSAEHIEMPGGKGGVSRKAGIVAVYAEPGRRRRCGVSESRPPSGRDAMDKKEVERLSIREIGVTRILERHVLPRAKASEIDSRIVAVKFYEKLGYKPVSNAIVKSGPFDCVRMRKFLI